jgi:chromate reductase, NAD(P)H dehydrogenase (quinone)
MQILGVAGSLRRGSYNRMLLRAASAALPPGAQLIEYDALKAIPPFDEDDEEAPPDAVGVWRSAIDDADGILFATPEYNASVPGQLKNAIDWASRPFDATVLRNKPVAVIGASTGMFGAVWAQAELRKALSTAGARVIDSQLPVAGADDAFAADGSLRDRDLGLELDNILIELVETIRERPVARQAA